MTLRLLAVCGLLLLVGGARSSDKPKAPPASAAPSSQEVFSEAERALNSGLYLNAGKGFERYVRLEPDTRGRILIPELDLRVGLLSGYVRYWHQDQLLDLPADLQARVDELAREVARLRSDVDGMTSRLRAQIEKRAQRAGRQDILNRLAGTTDPALLDQWLSELE